MQNKNLAKVCFGKKISGHQYTFLICTIYSDVNTEKNDESWVMRNTFFIVCKISMYNKQKM